MEDKIDDNAANAMAEAEQQKKNFDELMRKYDSLAEQQKANFIEIKSMAENIKKISHRPGQPDPIVQAPVDKYNDYLINNKGISSVRNRKLETSQTMENAQFDKINTTHNKGKTVSIVSDSDTAIATKPSVKLKLKKLKKHKSGLKKKNNMKTARKPREEEITKTNDENRMVEHFLQPGILVFQTAIS